MFDLAFELRRNFHRKSPPSERPTDRHTEAAREAGRPAVGSRYRKKTARRGREVPVHRTYPCNDNVVVRPRPTCTNRIDCLSIFTHLSSSSSPLPPSSRRLKAVRRAAEPARKMYESGCAGGTLRVYVQTNCLSFK